MSIMSSVSSAGLLIWLRGFGVLLIVELGIDWPQRHCCGMQEWGSVEPRRFSFAFLPAAGDADGVSQDWSLDTAGVNGDEFTRTAQVVPDGTIVPVS